MMGSQQELGWLNQSTRLLLAGVLSLPLIPTLHAQSTYEHVQMATDVAGHHLFTDNPAVANPDKFTLSYLQVQRKREMETALNFGNTLQPELKQKSTETNHALGVLFPMGGGAGVVLLGYMMDRNLESELDISGMTDKETFSKKMLEGRLDIKLVDKVRAGVGLRYAAVKNDVLGAFFLTDGQSIEYKGSMTGFSAGIFYDDMPLGLGVSYTAPMRGKATIEEEKLIMGESGFISVELDYGRDKDFHLGVGVKRWMHKPDDRSKPYQVPGEQRDISLNGLDMEQVLLPVNRYSLGFDSTRNGNFFMRLSLAQTEYAFLFEPETAPGEEPDLETRIKAYHLRLAGVYQPTEFSIQLGASYEQRKGDGIEDTEGRFSGGYEDYKATETSLFAAFTYRK